MSQKLVVRMLVLVAVVAIARTAGAQTPMPYGVIGLETARKVAQVAIAEARKNGWMMAAAVVDSAGDLVYFERLDNTQTGSIKVAQEKARSAAQFKRPTKAFEDALVKGRMAILGLPGAIPLEGGVPLVVDGKIIGAIGVSGATSEQDGICANAGAESLETKPVKK